MDPLYFVVPGIVICVGWLAYLAANRIVRDFFSSPGFRIDP